MPTVIIDELQTVLDEIDAVGDLICAAQLQLVIDTLKARMAVNLAVPCRSDA
jgi:hypothetical protein